MQNPIQYAACPNCGQGNAKKVSYTWWGGMLGPALMTQVKCLNCGTQYNGKTGKSNQQNIMIYIAVSLLLGFCACGGIAILSYIANNN